MIKKPYQCPFCKNKYGYVMSRASHMEEDHKISKKALESILKMTMIKTERTKSVPVSVIVKNEKYFKIMKPSVIVSRHRLTAINSH